MTTKYICIASVCRTKDGKNGQYRDYEEETFEAETFSELREELAHFRFDTLAWYTSSDQEWCENDTTFEFGPIYRVTIEEELDMQSLYNTKAHDKLLAAQRLQAARANEKLEKAVARATEVKIATLKVKLATLKNAAQGIVDLEEQIAKLER